MTYDDWKTTEPPELCASCGEPFTRANCTRHAESAEGHICDDCDEERGADDEPGEGWEGWQERHNEERDRGLIDEVDDGD